MMTILSIVIPTFNRKERLLRLLISLNQCEHPGKQLEVIVVDNGSTDGTPECVKRNFPSVHLICNDQNLMAAKARNIGAQAANGDYVFFIDDDNVANDKQMLTKLVQTMQKNKQIGMIGPLMFYYSDPEIIWCAGAKYSLTMGSHVHIFRGKSKHEIETDDLLFCDYLPNAYLVSRDVISNVGLEDDKAFPVGFEEIDYALRIKQSGYLVAVDTSVSIWHDVPRKQEPRWSTLRVYQRGRTRIIFYRKHTPWRAILFPVDIAAFTATMLINTFSVRPKLIFAYTKGGRDGFRFEF